MAADALPFAEAHWERELPDVDLAARLSAWRPDLAARDWVPLGGGLRSLNFRSGELVVRLAAHDEHDLGKEAALLRRAAGSLRVPRLLDATRDALLLEHVAHEPLPGSAAAGARVGAAARWLHAHKMPAAGLLDATLAVAEPFSSAVDGLREWADGLLAGRAGRRLGAEAARVAKLWDGEDSRLREAGAEAVLLHGDFKPANLKWLRDDDEVLVLDWEFAWSGPALFDLGQLFRWGVPDAFADAFAGAYGPLPAGWRRTAELFDSFNLVAFLDRPENHPRRERDVRDRLRGTLRP